jgi:hypothetical protein
MTASCTSSSSREGSRGLKVRSPVRTGYGSPSKLPLRKTREVIKNLGNPVNSVATGSSKNKNNGRAATGRIGMTVEQLEDMQKALEVKSNKKCSRSSTNKQKLNDYDPRESYTQEKKRKIDEVLSEDYTLICIHLYELYTYIYILILLFYFFYHPQIPTFP